MIEPVAQDEPHFAELTSEIVAAYVSHNALSPTDIPKLIADVHSALQGLGAPPAAEIP